MIKGFFGQVTRGWGELRTNPAHTSKIIYFHVPPFSMHDLVSTLKNGVIFTKHVDDQINDWIGSAKPADVKYLGSRHFPETGSNAEYDVVLIEYTPAKDDGPEPPLRGA